MPKPMNKFGPKSSNTGDVITTLRTSPELHEAVKEMASYRHETVNQMLIALLEREVRLILDGHYGRAPEELERQLCVLVDWRPRRS